MTGPAQDTHADTRTRLLEAAVHCFAEKGFEGAGIREIALRAQANSALVQYHFGGKEGLYLETLRFVFDRGAHRIDQIPQPPDPADPDARRKALVAFRAHISAFLSDCLCQPKFGGAFPEDLEKAAVALWNREVQSPQPRVAGFLKGAIQPFIDHLIGCMRVLRPDLDDGALLEMDMCVHAQLTYIHNHADLIAVIRGRPYGPEDLPHLVDHFTGFSLRGLGLAGGDLTQGD